MADALEKKFGATAELIAGGGGIFDVCVDGNLVFSKHQVGAFPDHGELLARIANM